MGTLYLCATPIGNLEDITLRVLRTLKEVDLIAAEDTRNSIKLLNHFDIKTPMTSYHEYNKVEKAYTLIEKMQEVFELFRYVPENLTEQEVVSAITQYDGDGSKPYCDLVYCGLSIIRKYLKKRSEYDEWRKGNLPEGF